MLLLASEDERQATDLLARRNPAVTKDIVAPGRVHGTQMFGAVEGIESKIVEFLARGVGGRSAAPVASAWGGDVYYSDIATLRSAIGHGEAQLRWYSSAEEAEARGLGPAAARLPPPEE
jgi:hypothetical protein